MKEEIQAERNHYQIWVQKFEFMCELLGVIPKVPASWLHAMYMHGWRSDETASLILNNGSL